MKPRPKPAGPRPQPATDPGARPEAAPLAADPRRMEVFLVATPGLEQPLADEARAQGLAAQVVAEDGWPAALAGARQGAAA